MPIIIEGGSRSAGGWWARHLQNTKTNERARLVQIDGLSTETVPEMFREMRALARGTKCRNYFYQASINPRADEDLAPAQWRAAVETLGHNLGLAGQPYFVIEHQKAGRTHRHAVWSRIDQQTMTAIPDSLTARIHEQTSRQLEAAFDLEAGTSILVPSREFARPARRAKKHERFRGAQKGLDPHAIADELTALRERSDSGTHFRAALEAAGYVLARGDRRDFVVVDRAGDDYSLGRQLGMKTAVLRAFMKDVEAASLPSVSEAKTLQQQRPAEHKGRPPHATPADAPAPRTRRNGVSQPARGRGKPSEQPMPEPIAQAKLVDATGVARVPERHFGKIKESEFASMTQSGAEFRLDPNDLRRIVNRLAGAAILSPGITEVRATFEIERYAATAFRPERIDLLLQHRAGADEARMVLGQAEQADLDIGCMIRKADHGGGQAVRKTGQALEMIPAACRTAEREEELARERQQRECERADSTRPAADVVRGDRQQNKAGFGGAIRKLFREMAKALAGPAPAPKKSGRRGGKGAFGAAANKTTRPRHLLTRRSAMLWLADTLDWFALWHNADPATEETHAADRPNHLFPHL